MSEYNKVTTQIVLMVTALIIFLSLVCFYSSATAEENNLPGVLTIDFTEETAIYTEHHEFSSGIPTTVTVTASVPENECHACMKTVDVKDCIKYFNICN